MEPKNEMGVVVRFAQECQAAGWDIVSVQSAFPDCVIRNMKTNEIIKVEFEYNSSSFYTHRHDAKGCDLIVCWINDWKQCVMPVWELSDPNWFASAYVNKMDEKDEKIMTLMVEVAYWKSKANEPYAVTPKSKLKVQCRNSPMGCTRTFASQNSANAHARSCAFKPIQIDQSLLIKEKSK